MAHPIYRVVSFHNIARFTLRVRFDDGESQVVDFEQFSGGSFRSVARRCVFDQVNIDPEAHTLVWPNGAYFDPVILHNWPESGPALEALADTWQPQYHRAAGILT